MPVKKLVKALYLLIVGLIVFTGALMIARGMRAGEATQAPDAPAVREIPLDDDNNSAA